MSIRFLLFILLLSSCSGEKSNTFFYMPGEFEPHEAVWLGWEEYDTTMHEVVYDIIKGLDGNVPVKIAIDSDSLKSIAQTRLSWAGIDTTKIQFYVTPGDRYWIRDHGAAFLVNQHGELAAADFGWNLYGYFAWWRLREPEKVDSIDYWEKEALTGKTSKVDSLMGVHTGARHIKSKLIMEGGSIESNGKGVLIQNEAVTLQRNPGWTKEEIEAEYKRVMNVQKVIWMKQGLADDEHIWHLHNGKYVTMGTGGHTDEFVRFADARTILLAWVDESEKDNHPLNQATYERMQENLKILETSTDQDGKPFHIIKVPLPNLVEWPAIVVEEKGEGEFWKLSPKSFLPHERPQVGDTLIRVAATSYLNFLVTNGVVLNASYVPHGTPTEREEKVKAIFKEVFPDRDQVWIDALPLNRNGGGIHCSTQQQPKQRK
ncbi:MAG: agmatine deiminase family protein [Cyclobacteriaceae bacterium]|nr:agmatine deiminase family protein [Cyclobacteriaceae bacterium]